MNTLMFAFFIASLTMSAVIVLLLFLNKVLENKISAIFRYYMWLIVLLGLLIPFRPSIAIPFEPVQIPILLGNATISSEQMENEILQMLPQESAVVSDAAPTAQMDEKQTVSYTAILLGIWITGMVIILAFHLRVFGKFIASVHRWGTDVTDEQTNLVFQKVWKDFGFTGSQIALKECIFLSSPMLIGFRKPAILLPEKSIPSDELEHIFRHELTHYRRRDLWINLLVLLVSAIHWFNPFVYLMAKAIRSDCEVACDEAVVAGKDSDRRKHYGETIIAFIGTKNEATPLLSTYFFGGKNSMKKRLFSIMEISRKRKGLATLCVLAIITMTLLSGNVFAATTTPNRVSRHHFTAQGAPQATPNDTAQYIDEAKAKSIALAHAGLSESQVTFIKTHLERDDGRIVYDVEFYSDNVEYDYEIDAVSGSILEFDRDIEHYSIPNHSSHHSALPQPTPQPTPKPAPQPTPKPTPQPTPSGAEQHIGETEAKSIALAHAGISESQVTFIKTHLERDDGRIVYDVEFYSDNVEYDYEIDAVSGAILEFDRDIEHYSIPNHSNHHSALPQTAPQSTPKPTPQPTPGGAEQYIGETEAKSIALAAAGLSETQVSRMRVKLDREDGLMVYEVEFNHGRTEFEYEIDATTGKIVKADIDYDD